MEASSAPDKPVTYPYEIHLTVRNPDPTVFRTACHLHGMKPLFLDLQTRTGTSVMQDVMATHVICAAEGAYIQVIKQLEELTRALHSYGLHVTRRKIETAPWNPLIETAREHVVPGYWEAHVQVFVQDGMMGEVSQIAKETGAHLSRNIYKAGPTPGVNIYMMTLRDYQSDREGFEVRVRGLTRVITEFGFPIRKIEVEYAIHDSSHAHDADWLLAVS